MQLKKSNTLNIRYALSAATCSLLGTATCAHAIGTDKPWEFNIAALYYSESDDRMDAFAPTIRARKELNENEYITLKGVIDSLTGASPTGAMPSGTAQTFTRVSGSGESYTVAAGEIPVEGPLADRRIQLSAEWEKPLSDLTTGVLSANVSSEHDFLSSGLSATFSHDFNKRNTTLSAGVSYESNRIEPSNGIPIERSELEMTGPTQNFTLQSDNRTQTGILLSLTQAINIRTIMQFNYSYGHSNGYHSDPFKLVSVIDDNAGPNEGNAVRHIFESRPTDRTRHSVFWKTMHHLSKNIIDLSYRYLNDNWGIESHTVDIRYTVTSPSEQSGTYWQPHLRYYQQSAANFYRSNLFLSSALPDHISADYRLGELNSLTIGLKYSHALKQKHTIAIRLEYLMQTGKPSSGSQVGNLENIKIIPDTNATIIQLEYTY